MCLLNSWQPPLFLRYVRKLHRLFNIPNMTSGCICKFVQSKRVGYYRYIVVVDCLKLPRHDRPLYHKISNPYHYRNSSIVLGFKKGHC